MKIKYSCRFHRQESDVSICHTFVGFETSKNCENAMWRIDKRIGKPYSKVTILVSVTAHGIDSFQARKS